MAGWTSNVGKRIYTEIPNKFGLLISKACANNQVDTYL